MACLKLNGVLEYGMSEESLDPHPPDDIASQLASRTLSKRQRALRKVVAAALGSLPWVGGLIAAMFALRDENQQVETDSLQRQWLEEHKGRMEKLSAELSALTARLEDFGEDISERLESEEYLAIIRKGFRTWDQADTDQKRGYVGKLLANAGAKKLCDDDLVRLFLEWLDRYHEAHFKVIREIYGNRGATRYDIWRNIHGTFPREDSSEADLFRLLIGELSQGRIIRQHRETTYDGKFVKKPRTKTTSGMGSTTMKSAFDDEEEYELTELGRLFVHYVFTDLVKRVGDGA
jgi:hypothetical protein